jgi:hypothetical protein
MPVLIGRNGNEISKKNSPLFDALDDALQYLENAGAKSILIVWDISAFIKERDKYIRLYDALKNRGRNIQLVCTTYDILGNDDIINRFNTQFKIDIQLRSSGADGNKSELDEFRTILKQKARMPEDQIDEIIKYMSDSNEHQNLMALFYLFFYALRPNIALGVHKEATKTVKEILYSTEEQSRKPLGLTAMGIALEKAGFKVNPSADGHVEFHEGSPIKTNIEKFLCITAICSKFSFGIPSSLAFRISGAYDFESIKTIRDIPFFQYRDELSDDFSFRIRTKLEAGILLEYFRINPEIEIKLITDLISNLNLENDYTQQTEVNLVSSILFNIGPNSNNPGNHDKYSQYYPEIIDALANIRKLAGNNPIPNLILQEVTYIREYYAPQWERSSENQSIEKSSTVIKHLLEAIEIADETLVCMDDSYQKDMLVVEASTSRIQLCKLAPEYIAKHQCEIAKNEVEKIWLHNPDDAYSYTAWIRAAKIEYDSCENGEKQAELLAQMCNVIDRVRTEKPEVANNEHFYKHADEIYSILKDGRADKYFDE